MTKIDRPDDVSHAELNAIVHNLLGTHDGGNGKRARFLQTAMSAAAVRWSSKRDRSPSLRLVGLLVAGAAARCASSSMDCPTAGPISSATRPPPKKALLNLGTDESPRPVLDLGRLAWRHDVTLCPQHTKMLADLLYADPGADPLLSQTAGRA